jgi:carboxymethylenebutenolidase
MTEDGARAERARALLETCGVAAGGMAADEAVRRADEIAAAAAAYTGTGETADASVFDEHMAAEFELRDIDRTMATMVDDPYLNHVAVMTGGRGAAEVRRFYEEHFIPRWPADTTAVPVSRTAGREQVVDELVMSFTHDVEMDFMLPGMAPTGRPVQLPVAAVVGVRDGRVTHEHIYWDQATILVQVGALDPADLPVTGADQARKVLDRSLAPNGLIPGWSAGATG